MYAQVAIKPNPLLRNGAYGIVMRGVQKCTRGCSSLRGRNKLPLCCIKLDTATDPACGSGNFLTETYISLRRLENEVLRILSHGQISFGDEDLSPIQVSIDQFYGIEINDFAVTVAKTALWIAESQMMKETEDVVHMSLDFLPLKSYTNITEGNALEINWKNVVSNDKLNYIMGINWTKKVIKFKSTLNKNHICKNNIFLFNPLASDHLGFAVAARLNCTSTLLPQQSQDTMIRQGVSSRKRLRRM